MVYVWGGGGSKPNDYTWTANATLSGCRVATSKDDIVLDFNWHAHDASVISHIHGDEGIGDALDSAGNSDIRPVSWSPRDRDTGDTSIQNGFSKITNVPAINIVTDNTIEAWFYKNINYGDAAYSWLFVETNAISTQYWGFRPRSNNTLVVNYRTAEGDYGYAISGIALGWNHICIERSGTTMYAYLNGVLKNVGGTSVAAQVTNPTFTGFGGGTHPREIHRFVDLYMTQSALHSGSNFSPTLYVASGTVVVTHSLGAGKVLSAIDWSDRSGASYGYVSKVEVNTGSDGSPNWVAVGGTNPTPPLTGLSYTIPQDCVRFTLVPRANTILSDTPVLKSVMLELSDADPETSTGVYHETGVGIGMQQAGRTVKVIS